MGVPRRWHARRVDFAPAAPISDRWRPDYQLLRDSPITRIQDLVTFDGVAEQVRRLGYRLVTADASSGDGADVLRQVSDQISEWSWAPRYALSLDGFSSALRDIDATATAFAFSNFDRLRSADPNAARAILDSLANAAWFHVLEGRLVLTLLHAADDLGAVATFSANRWRGWWVRAE